MDAPTYRQRLTGTGAAGVILILVAPLIALLIWSSWTIDHAWMAVALVPAILGAVMVVIGREHYDAAEDDALREIAAERIAAQKVKR